MNYLCLKHDLITIPIMQYIVYFNYVLRLDTKGIALVISGTLLPS